MNKIKEYYKFIIAVVLLLVVIGALHLPSYLAHLEIEKTAYRFLTLLQQEKYDDALKYVAYNDEETKILNKEKLIKVSRLLKSSTWNVEYVKFDVASVLILIYINNTDSDSGRFEYIEMIKLDGEPKVLPFHFLDPNRKNTK